MSNLGQAVWVELLKARRARLPLLTALGFCMLPLVGGFFMIILKDPEMARRAGLISAKAQLLTGTADWPTFLSFLSQASAIGGIFIFGLIASWVFGREYSDRTIKDLLALPTSRSAIVLAKFAVILLWTVALTGLVFLIGLAVGLALALPPVPLEVITQGSLTLAIATCLTILLVSPVAFVASAGHGYLAPMGATILFVALAQIIAVIGWGEYFPWSVPALYSQMAGGESAALGAVSYWIVVLTCLAGVGGTVLWWELADQSR
jgi:ABC-2 type transport system permease protein